MSDFKKIESALNTRIISSSGLGGGCIGNAQKVKTEPGELLFIKSYPGEEEQIIRNEANGLKELGKSKAVKVPEVLYFDDEFIILEYIESGRPSKSFWEDFGREFAQMHRFNGDQFGFFENNFIGANPQINQPYSNSWKDFYFENRLLYQFKLAERNGFADGQFRKAFANVEDKLDSILEGSEEKPSVLHGDLWSGNYMVGSEGNAVIIDPAVYYGHREADLAMTELFGRFGQDFYDAYDEEFPLPDGHRYRSNIYKLYHIMNHLNLFGSGYYSQSVRLMNCY